MELEYHFETETFWLNYKPFHREGRAFELIDKEVGNKIYFSKEEIIALKKILNDIDI